MATEKRITSIHEIDLSPKPGKVYWTDSSREWREEFIYFLLVDRFHDDLDRVTNTVPGRQKGFGSAQQLKKTCGGTLRGITRHLDYIRDLGCTALWLSPVFENNDASYHGYAIQNYLNIDSELSQHRTHNSLRLFEHRRKQMFGFHLLILTALCEFDGRLNGLLRAQSKFI